MNAAYLQPAIQIEEQIIVCESGKFKSVTRSDFDIEFDKTTVKPGSFYLEKQCSGAYLGPVSTIILQTAAREGLFSEAVNKALLALAEPLTLIEMDKFLHGPFNKDCALGKIACQFATPADLDIMYQLLDAVVERSARCSAAILTACAIQTGKGQNAANPICILCNGTTFYKTWMVRERTAAYLDTVLTNQLGIHWEIVSAENDITLGTAIAGLIE